MSAYAVVEFTDQQLIGVRGVAMDARLGLLDGLPTPTEGGRESE